METPAGLQKPKRVIGLAPVVIAVIAVAAVLVFALSHLATKGPAPQLNSSTSEIATGQTPQTRDAYTMQDFNEPKSK